jgi:hypothetical protein
MANDIVLSSRDWLSSHRTHALAWGIPKAAIVAALFIPPPVRTGVWIIAHRLDGYCVHPLFKAARTDPLPLYGPLLAHDDRTGARASSLLTSMHGFRWPLSFLAEA